MFGIRENGFTLIEVIVASMVLCSAIVIGSAAFKTAVTAVEKVTANLRMAEALPDVMALVKADLQNNKTSGSGTYGRWINYHFSSEDVKTSRTILGPSEFGTGVEYGAYQVTLKDVHLEVEMDLQGNTRKAMYEYQELTWSG